MNKFKHTKLVTENFGFKALLFGTRNEYVSDGSEMIFLDANENPFEKKRGKSYPDPNNVF